MHKRTVQGHVNRRKTRLALFRPAPVNPLLGVHVKLVDHQQTVIRQMDDFGFIRRGLAESKSRGDLLNLILVDLVIKGRFVLLKNMTLLAFVKRDLSIQPVLLGD